MKKLLLLAIIMFSAVTAGNANDELYDYLYANILRVNGRAIETVYEYEDYSISIKNLEKERFVVSLVIKDDLVEYCNQMIVSSRSVAYDMDWDYVLDVFEGLEFEAQDNVYEIVIELLEVRSFDPKTVVVNK